MLASTIQISNNNPTHQQTPPSRPHPSMAGTKNTHPHTSHRHTHVHQQPLDVQVLMSQNPNSVLDPHPRTQHE